jgi:hypothetical protein
MAEYQLTYVGDVAYADPNIPAGVLRTTDGWWIPEDPENPDWQAYQQWLADGGVPDPYTQPTVLSDIVSRAAKEVAAKEVVEEPAEESEEQSK